MAQRVYIVWRYPLFHETVSLLLEHPEIAIVGSESDRKEAQREITELMPDIIILEEDEETDGGSIDAEILQFMETEWEPRIARLSLQDNVLRLYQREQRTISNREDLLSILQT